MGSFLSLCSLFHTHLGKVDDARLVRDRDQGLFVDCRVVCGEVVFFLKRRSGLSFLRQFFPKAKWAIDRTIDGCSFCFRFRVPPPLFCGLVRSDSRAEDKKPLTGSCLRSSHGAAGSLRPRREEERGARAEVTRAARRGRGERRVRLDNCGGGSSSDRGAREESSGDRRRGSAERTAGAARGRQGGHEKVRGGWERETRGEERQSEIGKCSGRRIQNSKKKKTLEHSSPSLFLSLSLAGACPLPRLPPPPPPTPQTPPSSARPAGAATPRGTRTPRASTPRDRRRRPAGLAGAWSCLSSARGFERTLRGRARSRG